MKVLFFASTDDCLGGAKSLLELVDLLKSNGVELLVINPFHNKLNEKLDKLGIENYSAGYHLNICRKDCKGLKFGAKYILKFIRYSLFQLRAIRYIERTVDFSSIDIIHTNNSVEDIGVYFSKKYNKPHIWHLREFGDLDFNFYYFHKNIGQYISEHSTYMVAISNAIKKAWIKKGAADSKIVTICHGVKASIIEQAEHQNEKIRMIFAGTIIPEKGQFEFIKALTKLNEADIEKFQLDFYGTCEDAYLKELIDYIKENNLEQIVSFKGYTNHLNELLKEYDIGIINSRCEAMGRVTIEYMLAGLCVLASDRGANIELIDHEQYGLLYEYDNVDSIVEKLVYISNHPQEVIDIGKRARKNAMENYSIEKNVMKFIELYRRVINE